MMCRVNYSCSSFDQYPHAHKPRNSGALEIDTTPCGFIWRCTIQLAGLSLTFRIGIQVLHNWNLFWRGKSSSSYGRRSCCCDVIPGTLLASALVRQTHLNSAVLTQRINTTSINEFHGTPTEYVMNNCTPALNFLV